jgi:hypothetical protein
MTGSARRPDESLEAWEARLKADYEERHMDARDMTPAQFAAAKRKLTTDLFHADWRAQDERALAEIAARYPKDKR